MKLQEKKQRKINRLLALMVKIPMTRHDMAKAADVDVACASKWITELKFKRLIYIAKHERTSKGKYMVYYLTGDEPDALPPKQLDRVIYTERYTAKKKNMSLRELRAIKAARQEKKRLESMPKPDIAASWMWNPIC